MRSAILTAVVGLGYPNPPLPRTGRPRHPMLTALIRRRAPLLLGTVLLVAALLVLAVVALGGGADVVVYNGRSQYGDESVFKAFEKAGGKKLRSEERRVGKEGR